MIHHDAGCWSGSGSGGGRTMTEWESRMRIICTAALLGRLLMIGFVLGLLVGLLIVR